MKREWLVKLREQLKMTHDDVAELVGINRSTYTRYESGLRTPKPQTAVKIAEILNFDAGKFFWPQCTDMEHSNPKKSA